MKRTNLISVLWGEEVVWFYRMKEMKQKLGWAAFLPALLFQFLIHHAFVFMHLLAEVFLYAFSRKTFQRNLKKMQDKVRKHLNYYRNLEKFNSYNYGT